MAPPPRCNRGTTRSFLNSAVFSQLESRQIDGVCKDENDQQRRDEERRGYMLFAHHRSPLLRSPFSGFVQEFQRLSPPVSINSRGTQSSSCRRSNVCFPPIADISGLNDVARMSGNKSFVISFYVAFALWFTATRYSPPSFYSSFLSPAVTAALTFTTVALFLAVLVLVGWGALKARSFPWLDAAVAVGAVVGFDLFWRFFLSPLAWDAFKLTSIALGIATPLIVVLGVVAMFSLWRPSDTALG